MNVAQPPLVLIAAGGTGGHLFPAEALAGALAARGIAVELATDNRAAHYARNFPTRALHVIRAETVRSKDISSYARTGFVLAYGVAQALRLFRRIKPSAVVGFGGYPTVPPVIAAWLLRVPTIVHEQNAVIGRANKLLVPIASAVATGYPGLLTNTPKYSAKATQTGNPVRPAVRKAAEQAYVPPGKDGPVRILVFGGSQGARVMSEVAPAAIERLPAEVRKRVEVTQQCRTEDVAAVKGIYWRLGLSAEVRTFFDDLPARMAAAHLVIARSGAATVSELAAIGRPSVLVPLPHALDQDQLANASALAALGGALIMLENDFTPEALSAEIARLVAAPQSLSAMAQAARRGGRADAAEALADLVVRVAQIG
jgi:UDP-N-acetylglucosamine--N-acetylmuramyl-(pentapeptide) pyrophosphoryl-undecaprenol N-acetylglucosamine transferase